MAFLTTTETSDGRSHMTDEPTELDPELAKIDQVLNEEPFDEGWMGFNRTIMGLAKWSPWRPLYPRNDELLTRFIGGIHVRATGVYLIRESSDYEPVWTSYKQLHNPFLVKYIGMSTDLISRLNSYRAAQDWRRPPVYNAVRDAVLGDPEKAHDFMTMDRALQRMKAAYWMRERNFVVRVALTQTAEEAKRLEATLIRMYEAHDVPLWNSIRYSNSVTFPAPELEEA
jgi:hypothetical protein